MMMMTMKKKKDVNSREPQRGNDLRCDSCVCVSIKLPVLAEYNLLTFGVDTFNTTILRSVNTRLVEVK